MQVRFWGTRGSIPVPGSQTIQYGGNTSCIEVLSDAGTLLIIDCGTGLRTLGQHLINSHANIKHGYVLLSHTHWDHIQGIPFFLPFFTEGYQWEIYGPKGLSRSIKDTLAGQMQYSYFPVGMGHFDARINYYDLLEGVFYLNEIKVSVRYLNHTALTCGFRVEVDGCTLIYYCDHEPYAVEEAYGNKPLTGQDEEHAKFAQGADLIIHDAQYTVEEYPKRIGWGHSTGEYACKVAQYAGAKKLVLTHHDPYVSDTVLEENIARVRNKFSKEIPNTEIIAAKEGLVISLQKGNDSVAAIQEKHPTTALHSHEDYANRNQSVLVYALDPKVAELFIKGAQDNHLPVTAVGNIDAIKDHVKIKKMGLIVIEHNPPKQNAEDLVTMLRQELATELNSTPIVVVNVDKSVALKAHNGISESLSMPLSQAYVQTKILAWMLRVSCRWQPAQMPSNEKERLSAVYDLKILDTEKEERFDRITRLATALFHVPAAIVSIVDAERQWFKSIQGFDMTETHRDLSFCSHAVYENKTLIINDTAIDERFADNPLVTGEPHIRFYAGCPLILKDGHCIGTLCIIDLRPRVFDKKEIEVLEDLRDMVIEELYRKK